MISPPYVGDYHIKNFDVNSIRVLAISTQLSAWTPKLKAYG